MHPKTREGSSTIVNRLSTEKLEWRVDGKTTTSGCI